jgi:predicted transposase/invertase (TIGR01784 family)
MKNETNFISLLSDYGFKVAFADESNTLFLRKALQALLKSDTPIQEVKFMRGEFVGTTKEGRGGTLDLVCMDEQKRIFVVEMQLGYYKHFVQRAKFYAFQRLNTLVKKGDYEFDDLKPIYCIVLLAKTIFPSSEESYHFCRLKNQVGEEIDNQMTYIFVEISKFKKNITQLTSDFDKLIYTMKHLKQLKGLERLPEVLTEDWLMQAIEKVDNSVMTPAQRAEYEIMLAKTAAIIYKRKEEEEEVKLAKEEAHKAKKEAQKTKEEAQKTKEEAQKTKEEAQKTKEEAQKTKEEAQKTKEEAQKTKEEAQKTKEEAHKAKKEAQKTKEEAIKAKEEALKAQQEAQEKALKEKRSIAKELKNLGTALSLIVQATGLPLDEVERL